MPRRNTPPSYRLHRPSGLAVVTIAGRDHYLGKHGSRASREKYARLIANHEAGNGLPVNPSADLHVVALCLAYWRHVKASGQQVDAARAMVRVVRESHGRVPVREFGPRALKAVRLRMIERGWSRGTVNRRVAGIKRMFKWGVAEELVPVEVYQALLAVDGLKRGEQGVRDTEPVKPVPMAHVEAVLPHLSEQVAAIVRVMLHTGARCDEVCRIRSVDIDVSGAVWTVTLTNHKNAHRNTKPRRFWLGPRAQRVVEPFLSRPLNKPLFSPSEAEDARRADAEASRTTPASCGNTRGSNRTDNPKRRPGERYTTASVRRAISRACVAAGVPVWTPHRVRHLAATEYRKAAGLEAASIVLGHASATLTDHTYAERDATLAEGVILKHG